MLSLNRRQFLGGTAAIAAAKSFPMPALAQAKPKLAVVGGGPGGATLAKYVARDSNGAVEVTLVEPLRQFTTCFHSNLYLGGLPQLGIDQPFLRCAGIQIRHQADASGGAGDRPRARRAFVWPTARSSSYDRLAVAPGIDIRFDSVPGYSEAASEALPHAWKPGPQTQLLKRQLDAVEDGGVIVMVAPPNPFRCPPGPYERASMMAHVLRAKGHRRSRIIILDAKESFSKQPLFQEGWEKHYPGMVEWQDPKVHGGIKGVDASAKSVTTDLASYKAALINVIPAQMAGKIARDAGLANQSGFCPIDPASMRSANDPNIYVVGDACIPGDMPKSAFSANSQAKVAALMIRGELTNAPTFPARYTNTCWSLIETDDTVKVGGRYEAKDGKIAAVETFVSQKGESAELRRQTQIENMGWYSGIIADVFS